MPIEMEFGRMELTSDLERQPSQTMRKIEGSVRIGVIGDFRGRGRRAGSSSPTPWPTVGCSRSIVTTSMRYWPVSLPHFR